MYYDRKVPGCAQFLEKAIRYKVGGRRTRKKHDAGVSSLKRQRKRAGNAVDKLFAHGFGNALVTLTIATMATLVLFFAGLGEVIMGVVKLAWAGVQRPDVV